ncbi:peptidase M28-like protein [Tissierella praeacuta]|uniref:M28 family peptidase n=1 Tax=Tissierella praeacuta TaxID=43131 RepID=UPI0010434068|nr:M28 family peptidase [Tissierella praeacuta]TCU64166.1 peptidase M28-like protein [Tissierella praeacuta]
MNKKDILNNFKHLDFNRVSKKQKKKAQNFIINSLDGKYKMNIQPKWYRLLFFIPWKKCYNIESESSNYEILLTAHYDTHGWRQFYKQAFIFRKMQLNSFSKFSILIFIAITLIYFLLNCILIEILNISLIIGLLIPFSILLLTVMGFPIRISSILHQFNSAPVHDDNNSGVVTLIHLAKLLEEKGYSHKVKLLFTDCEENRFLGSKVFVRDNLKTLRNATIINFDCVGRGDNLFITAQEGSKLAKKLQNLFLSRGIDSTFYNKSFSDDKVFRKKGLNSIGLIRADKDSKNNKLLHWTHTSHDVLENIDIDYIIELIEVISEFIIGVL